MLARKYNKRIKIYRSVITADGYGGNTSVDVQIKTFWASVQQNNSFRENIVGNSKIKSSYIFKIRHYDEVTFSNISDLTVVYNGKKYVINEVTYDDELRRFVNIIADGS